MRRFLNLFLPLGPLALIAYSFLCALAIFLVSRGLLTWWYLPRFATTPEYLWLFPIGVRMDVILISYAMFIPTTLLLLLPDKALRAIKPLLAAWCTGFLCLIIYMEIATFPFVEEFDLRPDQKFLEYLQHVREVATTLWKAFAFEFLLGLLTIILAARILSRAANYILANQRVYPWKWRAAAFPVVIGFLVLGARSTLEKKPANLSTASFSENHLANEFALNSTYTVLYAAYRMLRHEKNPSGHYGRMSRDEVFKRVAAQTVLSGELIPGELPFLQRQKSPYSLKRPMNVVIFIQESMGATDVGCLKGPNITPNLCRLKNEGFWFTQMYATGTRTVRGIEAVISSFLPTPARGVVKLGLAKNDFFTAGTVFSANHYETDFIYGGMSNFDEMRGFLIGNGFQNIHDEPTFEDPLFLGTWGVSDEDLVRRANEEFIKHGDKPFFSLILSTSNHLPYEFPDGRIELYEQPKQTHFNAIKYADYAIGLFFELAKKEKYFENTIFLVVADHNSHVRGNDYVPISKFHVPALIIGPNVPKKVVDIQASQIDLLPTLLHFTGLEATHPMIGRNLMNLPPGTPGRSFMQFGEHNAYRVEDDVIIQRPFLPPLQFTYRNERLVPATLNPEMARDALAHVYLPWILYSEQIYRTVPEEKHVAGYD